MTDEKQCACRVNDPVEYNEKYPEAIRTIVRHISGMSSELRTPLNTMIGFTELLLYGMEGPLTKGQRKKLNQVIENGYELLSLINDMLALSGIKAGTATIEPRMFDIVPKVTGVIQKYRAEADTKGIKLEFIQPDNVPMVYADKALIDQVLNNLVSNAVKYTEVGSVGIVCEDIPGEDHIKILVWDTGPGMKDGDKSKIFDEAYLFEQLYNEKENRVSLGLAVSKYFVELHGGKIWVEDNNECGSRFYFTLPKVQRGSKICVRKAADPGSKSSRGEMEKVESGGMSSRPCAVINNNICWCEEDGHNDHNN